MEISIFLSLVAYACATTFSPGPNNVLLLSCGAQYGVKKCRSLLFGIWTGLITVMLICSFGCRFVGEFVPKIAPVAKFVGAAYILWLGYKTLTRKVVNSDGVADGEVSLTFNNGFLLQFLNVKILMLGIAAYCSFILPTDSSFLPTLIFAITMALCAACGNLIWVFSGTLLLPIYKKYYKFFNLILAALLFYCVFKILFL